MFFVFFSFFLPEERVRAMTPCFRIIIKKKSEKTNRREATKDDISPTYITRRITQKRRPVFILQITQWSYRRGTIRVILSFYLTHLVVFVRPLIAVCSCTCRSYKLHVTCIHIWCWTTRGMYVLENGLTLASY